MGVSKIWVLAEATGGNVATITLELLAKARELADTVECVYGGDASGIAATLGAHGASKVYATGDLGGSLAGVSLATALAAAIGGGNAPYAIFLGTTQRLKLWISSTRPRVSSRSSAVRRTCSPSSRARSRPSS